MSVSWSLLVPPGASGLARLWGAAPACPFRGEHSQKKKRGILYQLMRGARNLSSANCVARGACYGLSDTYVSCVSIWVCGSYLFFESGFWRDGMPSPFAGWALTPRSYRTSSMRASGLAWDSLKNSKKMLREPVKPTTPSRDGALKNSDKGMSN